MTKRRTLALITCISFISIAPHADGEEMIESPDRSTILSITHTCDAEASALTTLLSETPRPDAPTPDDSSSDGDGNDHRWRLQVGGIGLLGGDLLNVAVFPIANLNHRWSWNVASRKSALNAGPMVELGLHLIIPYAQAGFEIRAGNLFFDLHGGGILSGQGGGHGPALSLFPLAGADMGYMFKLGRSRMEVETGCEIISARDPWMMGHLTFGFLW